MASAKDLILLCVAIACVGLATPPVVRAQDSIPPGTVLPIQLDNSLSSRKSKPGEALTSRILQTCRLVRGFRSTAERRITGHVLDVSPAAIGVHAKISLVFDAIKLRHSAMPITTNLRALTSPLQVDAAGNPLGGDRGTPSTAYDDADRRRSDLSRRRAYQLLENVVGEPVFWRSPRILARSGGKALRSAIIGNNRPQALWLFFFDACRVYGYPEVEITQAGANGPGG